MLNLLRSAGVIVAVGLGHGNNCNPVAQDPVRLMGNMRTQMFKSNWIYPGVTWQKSDTATLRPVTDTTVCRQALETIQHYMGAGTIVTQITLIYAGRYLVAQQLDRMPGNEFSYVFILDGPLHVLYPCPNGYSPASDGTCPPRKPPGRS